KPSSLFSFPTRRSSDLAKSIHIGTIQTGSQHFHAVNVLGVGSQIRTGAGCQLAFQGVNFFFQLTTAGNQLLNLVADVISAAFQGAGNAVQRGFFTGNVIQRRLTYDGFNTTDTRRDAAFGADFQQADITGALGVGTA